MSVNQFCGEQAFDFQHTYVAKLVQLIITLVNQILRGEDIRFKKLLLFVHIAVCNIAGHGEQNIDVVMLKGAQAVIHDF